MSDKSKDPERSASDITFDKPGWVAVTGRLGGRGSSASRSETVFCLPVFSHNGIGKNSFVQNQQAFYKPSGLLVSRMPDTARNRL